MHKILPFDRYVAPPLSACEHLVNIVKPEEMAVRNISLQELYDKHVRPGRMLYLAGDIAKSTAENVTKLKEENAPHSRHYCIHEAMSIPSNIKAPHAGKGKGALRVTPISLGSPQAYIKLALDRSYQFILHGSPVEFTIRFSGKHVKNKDLRMMPQDLTLWPWLHERYPHLRPDFILKSMPENSVFLVNPITDGKTVQFVIALDSSDHAKKNLTDRLFRVKGSVEKSIKMGTQKSLPMYYRARLQSAGNKAYSPETDVPGDEAQLETADDGVPVFEVDRYMPKRPDRTWGQPRNDKLSKGGYLLKPSKGKVWHTAETTEEPKVGWGDKKWRKETQELRRAGKAV
jgi:hypothetical protein